MSERAKSVSPGTMRVSGGGGGNGIPSTFGNATLRMVHDNDPRREILNKIGDVAEVEVFGREVLLAIYVRPEKTAGGVFLSDRTRIEDKYQGKVGLVIAKGPLAFNETRGFEFGGETVEPGDWIIYRPQDSWSLGKNGPGGKVDCVMVLDGDIKGRIASPDVIY